MCVGSCAKGSISFWVICDVCVCVLWSLGCPTPSNYLNGKQSHPRPQNAFDFVCVCVCVSVFILFLFDFFIYRSFSARYVHASTNRVRSPRAFSKQSAPVRHVDFVVHMATTALYIYLYIYKSTPNNRKEQENAWISNV